MAVGRRRALSLAAIIAAFGVLACGSVATSGAAHANANANRAAAHTEAARLLSLVQLPPGATRSTTEPAGDHGDLAQSGYGAATPNLVDAAAWWTTDASPTAVLSYVQSHRPAGARGWTSFGDSGTHGAQVETFSLPPVSGVLSQRVIAVTATRLTNGLTGVRVDGAAVWTVPRPAWERIPATVRTVTFTARGSDSLGRPGHVSAPVTLRGGTAQRLVSFINHLPTVQPGVSACPAGRFGWLRMTFRAGDGRTLASATEQPSGCATVALTIGGRRGPALTDYPTVTSELIRLGAFPTCTARQLTAASNVPGSDPSGQVLSLTFVNRSTAVCHVQGVPRLRAFDARGHRLSLTVHRARSGEAVPLDPGESASVLINWRACGAPRAARVRIALPGVRSAFTLAVGSRARPFAPCHGRVAVGELTPAF